MMRLFLDWRFTALVAVFFIVSAVLSLQTAIADGGRTEWTYAVVAVFAALVWIGSAVIQFRAVRRQRNKQDENA